MMYSVLTGSSSTDQDDKRLHQLCCLTLHLDCAVVWQNSRHVKYPVMMVGQHVW